MKRISLESISLVRYYNKETHPLDSSVINRLDTLRKAYGRPSLLSQPHEMKKEEHVINKAEFIKRSRLIDTRLAKPTTK